MQLPAPILVEKGNLTSSQKDSTDGDRAKVRVLVVDAEPVGSALLEGLLRGEIEVLAAKSEMEAFDLIKQNSDIAVILAFVGVGSQEDDSLDSLALLTRCSTQHPSVRRVLITGSLGDEEYAVTLRRAINEARVQFVGTHPIDQEVLGPAIKELAGDYLEARSEKRLARSQVEDTGDRDGTLVNMDRLTGLYNHRSFQERFREEISRARRYNQTISVIYSDLDNFASLNKGAGFRCGDQVIQKVSNVFQAQEDNARTSDIACRFGGQEFVALLPETDKAGAAIKAERLRESVSDTLMPGGVSVTLSIGVATFPEDGSSAGDVLAAAQNAVQTAKSLGRNQVFLAGGDIDPNASAGVLNVHADTFPTFHDRMGDLVYALERDRKLSCFYVDLSRLRRIEQEFGIAQHNQLLARAGQLLAGMRGDYLRRDDLLCKTDDADGYLCFLSPPRSDDKVKVDFHTMSDRVAAVLEAELTEVMRGLTRDQPQVAVGVARVLNNSMIRGERLIHRLVEDAKQSADIEWKRLATKHKIELQDLIINSELRTAFQPLVDLDTADSFGFEALTRGPPDSLLAMPTTLFSVADAVNLTMELDRSCFERALRNAKDCKPVHRLFLNLLPASFYDTHFIETQVVEQLDLLRLTPANLVFEITERLAIENFSAFRQALSRYTDMGFGVAVDDVGTRHSNLEAVMALQPHFIKLSEVLCRGVTTSTVKREMVGSLVRIARAIDAVTVAEGIEDLEDLMTLRDLGVRFGQGYFLARPDFCFPEVSKEAADAIRAKPQRKLHRKRPSDAPPPEQEPAPLPEISAEAEIGEDEDEAEPTTLSEGDAEAATALIMSEDDNTGSLAAVERPTPTQNAPARGKTHGPGASRARSAAPDDDFEDEPTRTRGGIN